MAEITDIHEIMDELERKKKEVDYTVKLPDAELEVMIAVWNLKAPVTTSELMDAVGKKRGWKAPTLISFLGRLEARGFLMSYKNGKERNYHPIAERGRYVSEVTRRFVETVHGGSFVRLLDSLFDGKEFSDSDIDELLIWLKTKNEK